MSPRDDLSMSTDNTAEGRMYSDTVEAGPISHVEIGDTVFDSNGKDVGKVKFVKMGDPDAATDKGQWTYEGGILWFGNVSDLRELPEQAQKQLMRVGYIHIDVSWAKDRFAGAGQIARVVDHAVHLTVSEEELI